jgi:hypothetical protein
MWRMLDWYMRCQNSVWNKTWYSSLRITSRAIKNSKQLLAFLKRPTFSKIFKSRINLRNCTRYAKCFLAGTRSQRNEADRRNHNRTWDDDFLEYKLKVKSVGSTYYLWIIKMRRKTKSRFLALFYCPRLGIQIPMPNLTINHFEAVKGIVSRDGVSTEAFGV